MTKRHLRILFIIALMLAAAVALPQITAHACQGGCEITCEDANVQVPLGINDGIIFDLIMQAGQTLQVISVWESGTTQGTVNINIEGSPYDSLPRRLAQASSQGLLLVYIQLKSIHHQQMTAMFP
jgi:hypothetical protein